MKALQWKTAAVVLAVMAMTVTAQAEDETVYEQQLRTYGNVHGEYTDKWREEYQQKAAEAEGLRAAEEKLRLEYQYLQDSMQEKEENVTKLKQINTRLRKAQSSMQDQYEELEDLFMQQKSENERLKDELQSRKAAYYQSALNYYREEEELLGSRIAEMSARHSELLNKIIQLEELAKEAGEEMAEANEAPLMVEDVDVGQDFAD
ncbi:MAG: hypothetical protein ACLFPX_03640 [Candidatus Omnitrophota bacterium]